MSHNNKHGGGDKGKNSKGSPPPQEWLFSMDSTAAPFGKHTPQQPVLSGKDPPSQELAAASGGYRLAGAAPVSSPVAPTWGAGGMLRVSRKSATSAHNTRSSNNSNSNASSGHHGNTNNNSSNSTSNSTSNSRRNSHTYAVGGGTAQTSPTEGMSYLPHPTAAIGSTRNHAWEVKVHLPNDYDNHAFNTAARGRAHAHASDALSNFAVAVSSGRNTGTSSSASVGGGNAGDSGLHGTGDQNSDSPGLGVMAFP